MPAKFFLKNLTVPSPCTEDWNRMKGNDQVRFCEHCDSSVHNLSQMTPNQALRLAAGSNGRLCIRFERDSTGRLVRTPVRHKLHQISRRASQIAAGAFSATLSITSAVGHPATSTQSCPPNGSLVPAVSQPATRWGLQSSVVGAVTDQHGAAIPSATVALFNVRSNLALYTSPDFGGHFRIDNLEQGMYRLRIEAPGFVAEDGGLYVSTGETRADRRLRVAGPAENVEVVSESSERFVTISGGMVIASPEHPFVLAAQRDDLEELASLIAGVDVNIRDKRTSTTALEHAVRNANREMVQLLLSAGAKVNDRDQSGETPLMMMDTDATSDLVWDLINAGAKVDLKDKSSSTALMSAASANNLDALRTLLDAGAEIDIQNDEGRTALMIAASEGHVHIVRALILAGANLTLTDDDDEDALSLAIDNGNRAVIRLLKSKGAFETVTLAEKKPEP